MTSAFRGISQVMRALRREPASIGPRIMRRLAAWVRQHNKAKGAVKQLRERYEAKTSRAVHELYTPHVLIAAELSLGQCAKYRVWQKREHFRSLGIPCTVIEWNRHSEIRNALQTSSIVIFYRVPGYPEVLASIAEARRLGVPTFWEADDLIFDEPIYRANANLDMLEPKLRKSVLEGIPLFRAALEACEYGIASTATLADAMRAAGKPEVFVIENGLDSQTVRLAETIRQQRAARPRRETVTILYGSGSKAHNADFASAAEGVLSALRQRPTLRLMVIGDLELPAGFSEVGSQVARVHMTDYVGYIRLMEETDIAIAPLAPCLFNDAKSSIKFLEAAMLKIPAVCSPRDAFRDAIDSGHNGFLAETPREWADTLIRLADDNELRERIGLAAFDSAGQRFGPERIANGQLSPLLARFSSAPRRKLRVLIVNVFYYPQSFGGATIVAEQLAARFNRRADMEVAVFTTWGDREARPYHMKRFEAEGVPVIAVRMPDDMTPELEYYNPRMEECFDTALSALHPDIVHFHSIQVLSSSIVDCCKKRAIPYAITLHDAWWICERQFMVRPEGRYCFQHKIDWTVCATCSSNIGLAMRRFDRLQDVLAGACLVLTPSEFHRQLHIANGVQAEKIVVNRNGVGTPRRLAATRADPNLVRFGFVGGAGPIKGLPLVRRAFEKISERNYELVLVDNTLNLGHSSVHTAGWGLKGKVRTVPAYTQASLDDFFDQIDVLLFASQWKESFGLTVREALLRDRWVIVTDAGGVVEDVVDGENGTIIPLGDDPAPLREAILALLREPARLTGYRNPHKARIITFDQQATELAGMLLHVASLQKNVTRSALEPDAAFANSLTEGQD
jgi:glycosyltransferase involved in cell wall biosynthesis